MTDANAAQGVGGSDGSIKSSAAGAGATGALVGAGSKGPGSATTGSSSGVATSIAGAFAASGIDSSGTNASGNSGAGIISVSSRGSTAAGTTAGAQRVAVCCCWRRASAARRSASCLARSTFFGFGGRVLASSASQAATSAFSGFEAPSKRSRKLWRPTPGNGFGLNAWELGADAPLCMATIRCVTPKPNAKQLPATTGPTQKRGRRFGLASLAG